jgi:hypothetical protein
MRRLLAGRGTPAVIVGVLMLFVVGGGYAVAASSGGSTIKACAKKKGGTLYTGKCHKGDKKLSWNTTGPKGATGAKGATGGTGAAGATGRTGPAGPVTLTHLISAVQTCTAATGCTSDSPTCPTGETPISGEIIDNSFNEYDVTSREESNGWFGAVYNSGGSSTTFRVGVICSSATSETGFSKQANKRGSAAG